MIILICCNDSFSVYTFRRRLIHYLIGQGYHVFVLCEKDEYFQKLIDEGINVINFKMNNTSKNIFKDYVLYRKFKKIVRNIEPDVIINYTIKPHLYMTLAARNKDIKIINFISGISSLLYDDNLVKKIIVLFYRLISRYTWGFIFLNHDDLIDFKNDQIVKNNHRVFVLNSEGVDLTMYKQRKELNYDVLKFLFVGRLVKEKGVIEYLEASKQLKKQFKNVEFYIAGGGYKKGSSTISLDLIEEYEAQGVIKYLGFIDNMEDVYQDMHVVVLPSYREGMPISLIEALATGKAVIASKVPGSKDIVVNNVNGFLCEAKDIESLKDAIIKYINLSIDEKERLSQNALQMASQYNVNHIIKEQLEIIEL